MDMDSVPLFWFLVVRVFLPVAYYLECCGIPTDALSTGFCHALQNHIIVVVVIVIIIIIITDFFCYLNCAIPVHMSPSFNKNKLIFRH